MSATVAKQKGFSIVEVLLAMMLMVMVVTGLAGYHRVLASRFVALEQLSPALASCLVAVTAGRRGDAYGLAGKQGADNTGRNVSASRSHLFLHWVGRVK
ncbi:Tfp pilus assembly protein PilV [Leclercia adecarboxylata]|uniref:Tfp pilus assembly protein PilV n=1 Tax=Leclercia adecarboxylata TaxID=83655 RepID=A0A4V6JKR5_9ENTR|nr:Tfp pilus assembly protein PilV [Leclercia adecarboxylata]